MAKKSTGTKATRPKQVVEMSTETSPAPVVQVQPCESSGCCFRRPEVPTPTPPSEAFFWPGTEHPLTDVGKPYSK